MNHSQISRISLLPEDVDCIVFWTKDPANMLDMLSRIDEYRYYFQFTLTPYGKKIETALRDKEDILKTFIKLSNLIGKNRVLWRYDPIIINDELDISYHVKHFERFCQILHSFTDNVTISFVDNYSKLKTSIIREISTDEMTETAVQLAAIAKKYGLQVKTCCEKIDLSDCGILRASCVDRYTIEKLCGYSLNVKQDKNQREGCGCCESKDIGAYNTCGNGCVYCYANRSITSALKNIQKHKSDGEFVK